MNSVWFRRVSIFFVPTSIAGWLILVGAIVYTIHVFIDISHRTGTDNEKKLAYVINLIIVFISYTFVGYFTSRNDYK